MTHDDGPLSFLASQPLLALTMVAILAGALGWRLQATNPRAGVALRNTAYVAMLGVLLLVIADVTRKATHSDAALLLQGTPKVTISGGETLIPMQADGHFWVEASVNGHKQRFMIDTGATYVSMSRSAAQAAGIAPTPGELPMEMSTANGVIVTRKGTVQSFRFGSINADGIEVSIDSNDEGGTNLIGMNLLSRLKSWHVEGNRLRLVPG